MNKPRIFRDFNLPRMHLEGFEHYVPPKARDDYEISRRRELPRGMLIAEQQRLGLLVTANVLPLLEEPRSITFAASLLAVCGLDSAWYALVRNAEVMSGRLKLTILAEEDRDYAPQTDQLKQGATNEFSNAILFADRHMAGLNLRHPKTREFARSSGRMIGNAALTVATLAMGEANLARLNSLPDDQIQVAVRRRSLMALHQAQVLTDTLGRPPSLAQLADADSDVAVHWRRQAPNEALAAYEEAFELTRAA